MGYIYKIINKIDGKIYIGQTRVDLKERWRQHKKISSNCRYLKNAIQKYGFENFEFKLILICFDEDLDKNETYYIQKNNTIVPNGYNLRYGGNSSSHNEETKKKISESLKGRTDIIYNKSNLGKSHSDEIKLKISNSLKGKKKSKESVEKRIKFKIFQIDKEGVIIDSFRGYNAASEKTGFFKLGIMNVCNGKRITSNGFFWKKEKL